MDNEDTHSSDGEEGEQDEIALPAPPEFLLELMSQATVGPQLDQWGLDPRLHDVFRVFEVLLSPPIGVELETIDGLSDYLRKLCTQLLKLPDNGVRTVATHCWWVIIGKYCISMLMCTCSDVPTGLCHRSAKRAQWKQLLHFLEKSRKRLVNWCPSVKFPSEAAKFPKSRLVLKSLIQMFFNPDSSLRLRMVPIRGMYTLYEY
jgi:hypothetical protein